MMSLRRLQTTLTTRHLTAVHYLVCCGPTERVCLRHLVFDPSEETRCGWPHVTGAVPSELGRIRRGPGTNGRGRRTLRIKHGIRGNREGGGWEAILLP